MKFKIEEVTVYFPYESIYPEQYQYMVELKRALDAGGHCLLEMPTGTGKTAALLSLIVSYSISPSPRLRPVKLLYCTRTVHEMEKTLSELRLLHRHLPQGASLLALGLSSRKNLCVNPEALQSPSRDSVDSACRGLTASWVRSLAAERPPGAIPLCPLFESYDRASAAGPENLMLPPGVYTLQDLRADGRRTGICPYYRARQLIRYANVVVYSYQYLLDPKVAGVISREMQRECVVVFDEAHNIDNVCIEALSVNIRQQTLDGATRNLSRMSQEIDR